MMVRQNRLLSWTYIVNKTVPLLRILLGGLFIYSGLFKAFNPAVFEKALTGYGIIPDSLFKFVSISFPWIEIMLGILLIFNLFVRIITIITVALFILFILITIINVFKGSVVGCGCFSESFFLYFSDPIKIVIRNILLATIAILLFFHYKRDLAEPVINNNVVNCMYAILLLFSVSTLFVLIGKKSNENKIYRMYLEDRNAVMDVVNELNIIHYNISDILKRSDILSGTNNIFTLIFIINSLDCNTCIDEALYVEQLTNKYKDNLQTIAVAGRIGKTALNNFIDRYKITYNFIQETGPVLKTLISIKTLKVLVNSEGIILNIDPPTFRSQRIRKYYETILLGYIKGVR